MSFFDQVYERLFRKENTPPPTIHKVLKRSERYLEGYTSWKNSDRPSLLTQAIYNSLLLSRKEIEQNPPVHLLTLSGSKGFALGHSSIYAEGEFNYLLDWFTEKVLSKYRYKQANADITVVEKGQQVQTLEKYYLKPINDFDPPIDQQFGNLLIENSVIGINSNYLKVMANAYSDRNYSTARDFDELVDFLLKPEI